MSAADLFGDTAGPGLVWQPSMLDARPEAKAFFEQLSSQNRYAILYRLHEAKRPETRARRLEKFVAMLEAGEKIYP